MSLLDRRLGIDPLLAIIVFHACIVRLMYVPNYNAIATYLCVFLLLIMLPKLRILFGGGLCSHKSHATRNVFFYGPVFTF